VGTFAPVKRRKPKAQRKEEAFKLRLSAEHKRLLSAAAARSGMSLSAFLLSQGLEKARALGVDR
jgi:uncharacterized protein (DUF1778 family)